MSAAVPAARSNKPPDIDHPPTVLPAAAAARRLYSKPQIIAQIVWAKPEAIELL